MALATVHPWRLAHKAILALLTADLSFHTPYLFLNWPMYRLLPYAMNCSRGESERQWCSDASHPADVNKERRGGSPREYEYAI
ncbi:hypothetical protein BJ165DRAFT_1506230 [Panaeolus papilionaceus]|nr:hypothetical protein BJ165DRAFT_1506230 [Panaeolus papilionaceus]